MPWFRILTASALLLTACSMALCLPGTAQGAAEQRPPNILWILAEDMGPDLSCYGAPAVKTPHLDRLAAEGARFEYACTAAPVCSTSRSAMMTGMYQNAIGANQHRTADKKPLAEPVTPFPLLLQKAGYFCGLMMSQKLDLNFQCDPKQLFPGGDWREAGERPFFVQVTIGNTHRTWHHHADYPVDPAGVVVPDYYPDTPLVRRDIANGLEEIQVLDATVGQLLKRLEDEGRAQNTLVIFMGDNGRCEVRGKQFLYEGGTRVPLLLRWPGHIQPGTVRQDLAISIDVTAMVLAASGVGVPDWMQGRDLLNPDTPHRQYVFTARDKMDDTHDAMRACRDRRFKYILNLMPERAYCQLNEYKEKQYPVLALLNVMHIKGQLNEAQDHFLRPTKPAEELYDLLADPFEVKNLASDPAYAADRDRMRKALAEWRKQVGDQGVTEEFRKGGWPGTYPTRSLAEWEAKLEEWNRTLLGPDGSAPAKPARSKQRKKERS